MVWEALDVAGGPADGPVAFCDDLSPSTVLAAYRRGLFPFPAGSDEVRVMNEVRCEADVRTGRIAVLGDGRDPYAVAWLSPDPRPVIGTGTVRVQRSLLQQLRNKVEWTTTLDRCFDRVVERCREGRRPRWITDRLVESLSALHADGHAHSVEVWDGDELVGGTFGVRVGGVFSADSQFCLRSGAGKVAVACLARRMAAAGGAAVDVQHAGGHASLIGAEPVPRPRYLELLREHHRATGALPGAEMPARTLDPRHRAEAP